MSLSKSKQFLIYCLSFIIGVAARSLIEVDFLATFIIFWLCLLGTVFYFKKIKFRFLFLIIIFIILGIWRYQLSVVAVDYNEQEHQFTAVVSQEPDVRRDHVKLTVSSQPRRHRRRDRQPTPSLASDGATANMARNKIKSKVLIKTELYPEYDYGDLLEISCYLRTPEPIEDFAYDKYLARYGIYSVCYSPQIKLIKKDQGNLIISYLLFIKKKFVSNLNQLLPEPQASFLNGLLLGARRSIPQDVMEAFSRTGTTHIVAISGYNITIIAVIFDGILSSLYVKRQKRLGLIVLGILFFVIISGAQASIVRAALMGYLVLIAVNFGRLSQITNAIILTGALIILYNPKILVFDVGFQLSFLATMGLVYLSPYLKKYLFFLPEKLAIQESATQTMAAIIMTTPIILYNFGRLSVIAPLANILVLPAIPITMALGFIAGLVSFILPIAAQIISWLAWFWLSYILWVIKILASFDLASLEIGEFSIGLVVMFYVAIVLWIRFDARKFDKNEKI